MTAKVTERDTRALLGSSSTAALAKFAKDSELVVALTAVLNASLEIAAELPRTKSQLASSLSKKALTVSGVAEKALDSKGLELTNFAVGQSLKSVGLVKLAGMTPAKASVYVTLTMAEKVVSAAGLAQFDKCAMAIASLTLSTGAGALVCVGSVGIGCVAGAIAIAADSFNVYAQCRRR